MTEQQRKAVEILNNLRGLNKKGSTIISEDDYFFLMAYIFGSNDGVMPANGYPWIYTVTSTDSVRPANTLENEEILEDRLADIVSDYINNGNAMGDNGDGTVDFCLEGDDGSAYSVSLCIEPCDGTEDDDFTDSHLS